ncbi:FAD-dependent oxidoreductase [Niabella ginsengisoli]|uniref:FAD-dependent oxidoreductase n=1 Tax=Niabella ginsengisoli TaxID=522298 RepID=UPI0021D3F48C|nr:FAD-dependent oxidoreductase [Niabella ginsengisoli]
MQTTKKKVVVIGGGFAGVNFVKQLAKHDTFEITLVDLNNYNFFPPLLYQVATGFLEPSSISYPFRKFLRHRENVRFRMAELKQVLPAENKVILSNGELTYDLLVMARRRYQLFWNGKCEATCHSDENVERCAGNAQSFIKPAGGGDKSF